jgi:hypothetical protein
MTLNWISRGEVMEWMIGVFRRQAGQWKSVSSSTAFRFRGI